MTSRWTTPAGMEVARDTEDLTPAAAEAELGRLEGALDRRRGLLLSGRSSQPGRYRPHDLGYTDPPVEVSATLTAVRISALNDRGTVLIPALATALDAAGITARTGDGEITGSLATAPPGLVPEEERTRLPSVFTWLRALLAAFESPADPLLGLYGAFGYDLALGFDPVPRHQHRRPEDRTLVLHLPDRLLEIDRERGTARLHRYEFTHDGRTTVGLPLGTPPAPAAPPAEPSAHRDHRAGEYAALVRRAQEHFRRGEMFEVVPGQSFHRPAAGTPSAVFRRLRERNPAPYGLLMNLAGEHLVGASPEMFVRVDPVARTVESCPISGTVARGDGPLEDAEQIKRLLTSEKEESELTMCTDVDRNDKARVCEPGSVRVLARRQIELYSRLIHTVDHVRGRLRTDRDALDAFLTHMWAVTVTGAPKRAAVEFIERHERSPRRWYGGAVGRLGFDGGLETALTLRTVQFRDGVATVRAGATLLHDSDPAAEEQETLLKALALLDAVENTPAPARPVRSRPAVRRRVLLVDHQDSFVHTLADYLRQTGADVATYRAGFPAAALLDELRPDLLVLSPGPGRPADFGVSGLLDAALERAVPVFGVCLGLQGIVEHFGGTLRVLPRPMHGKPSEVGILESGGTLFAGLPQRFTAGRYHSLIADPSTLPSSLAVTAATGDGHVMAVEHRELAVAGVQFHPESILTLGGRTGHALIANAVRGLTRARVAVAL